MEVAVLRMSALSWDSSARVVWQVSVAQQRAQMAPGGSRIMSWRNRPAEGGRCLFVQDLPDRGWVVLGSLLGSGVRSCLENLTVPLMVDEQSQLITSLVRTKHTHTNRQRSRWLSFPPLGVLRERIRRVTLVYEPSFSRCLGDCADLAKWRF